MTYLTAPHPELGRRGGPVCPFTASSISRDTFSVGTVDRRSESEGCRRELVAGMVTEFHRLPPMEGPGTLLQDHLDPLPRGDRLQRNRPSSKTPLKKESIPSGLMIGRFYPESEEPGIRNPEFRPLRSPVPLLAIRHMVSSDFPFLTARAEWIEEYLKRFLRLSLPLYAAHGR